MTAKKQQQQQKQYPKHKKRSNHLININLQEMSQKACDENAF